MRATTRKSLANMLTRCSRCARKSISPLPTSLRLRTSRIPSWRCWPRMARHAPSSPTANTATSTSSSVSSASRKPMRRSSWPKMSSTRTPTSTNTPAAAVPARLPTSTRNSMPSTTACQTWRAATTRATRSTSTTSTSTPSGSTTASPSPSTTCYRKASIPVRATCARLDRSTQPCSSWLLSSSFRVSTSSEASRLPTSTGPWCLISASRSSNIISRPGPRIRRSSPTPTFSRSTTRPIRTMSA